MSEFSLTLPPQVSAPSPRERLILALDFPSATAAFALLEELQRNCADPPVWVKVGLELFLAEGPEIVRALRARGYSVFLDLKLHDIPNTVAAAIHSLGALDLGLLTVHACGGFAMLQAAAESAAALTRTPRLLAVTVLTSMDAAQLAAVGVCSTPPEQVIRLARQAWKAGIRGLVASPLEAAMLRREFRSDLHLVAPGIRLSDDRAPDDQQRVATPASTLLAGASQLVIGRPITRAPSPSAAYDAIVAEIAAFTSGGNVD